MSKEWKAPDKVTQKMTRDGAVAENLTTGETTSISERPQEENYSQAPTAAAEKAVDRIGAEVERQAAKGAGKKALDAAQLKTHTSRLQFSEAERATPELQKSIRKSEKAADRLDAARAAIPKQTKIKKERVFDEAKGKAKTRLSFEKTDKPPNGKLRHNPLSRPAQELNSTVHGKIYEVEKENVGVESGHRVELAGEKAGGMAARTVKRGIRSHKLKPYRAAAAAERKAVKANADFLYQKALHDNPALAHSNPISRFWQKQRIKKQYAKTLKAGGKVKKTAEATAKAAKKTAQETKRATFFVVRHWKGCLLVGGIAFIVLLLFGGLSSCSLFGGNSGSGLIASSYLSEDADITGAESAYAAMEAELQDMLNNIEREYPGYDEYRVNADEIEHDPYVLISILSALHEGVFTLDEAQSTLEMLFEKQYILTVEEEVQVRYNLVAILPDSLTSPQLTAEWETRLTGIAKGSDSPADFMRGIEEMTAGLVKTYSAISEDKAKLFTPQREAIGTCPRCGAAVYEGKKNFYCSDRACSFVMWKNDRFFEQRKKAFTKAIAAALLKDGKVKIKGMYSTKTGKTFDGVVLLADTGGKYVNFRVEQNRK